MPIATEFSGSIFLCSLQSHSKLISSHHIKTHAHQYLNIWSPMPLTTDRSVKFIHCVLSLFLLLLSCIVLCVIIRSITPSFETFYIDLLNRNSLSEAHTYNDELIMQSLTSTLLREDYTYKFSFYSKIWLRYSWSSDGDERCLIERHMRQREPYVNNSWFLCFDNSNICILYRFLDFEKCIKPIISLMAVILPLQITWQVGLWSCYIEMWWKRDSSFLPQWKMVPLIFR